MLLDVDRVVAGDVVEGVAQRHVVDDAVGAGHEERRADEQQVWVGGDLGVVPEDVVVADAERSGDRGRRVARLDRVREERPAPRRRGGGVLRLRGVAAAAVAPWARAPAASAWWRASTDGTVERRTGGLRYPALVSATGCRAIRWRWRRGL